MVAGSAWLAGPVGEGADLMVSVDLQASDHQISYCLPFLVVPSLLQFHLPL